MKVLVVGELCVDRFVYGKVNRMCPEAPVPVLNPIEVIENNGMAGNVVDNLNSLSDDIEVVHWHQNNKLEKIRFVEKKSNHMIYLFSPIFFMVFFGSQYRKHLRQKNIKMDIVGVFSQHSA